MISFAATMRACAAILVLAFCFRISNALEPSRHIPFQNRLLKFVSCGQSLGFTKCLTAFSVWRAQRAVEMAKTRGITASLNDDMNQFPWERYSNETEENLYSELCDGTEGLLKYRQLTLDVNDFTFQLRSSDNGTLKVDVIKRNNDNTGRGYMKKFKKKFTNIIPFLLLPGLIMSAILPFVLPALKLMTIAVGMLNNMALSGAVFTLLRNNAFNEVNEHKILYVNEGYHNEKHYPLKHDHHFAESNSEIISDIPYPNHEAILIDDVDAIKDVPVHADLPWIQNGGIPSRVYFGDTKIKKSDSENIDNPPTEKRKSK